jgi:hypothetical protein
MNAMLAQLLCWSYSLIDPRRAVLSKAAAPAVLLPCDCSCGRPTLCLLLLLLLIASLAVVLRAPSVCGQPVAADAHHSLLLPLLLLLLLLTLYLCCCCNSCEPAADTASPQVGLSAGTQNPTVA